jgi:UDP-perosamine 4-acetyltransferase
MSLPVLIIGAGGHAAVVLDVLRAAGANTLGFADRNPALHGTNVRGIPVIGGDEEVFERHPPDRVMLANGVGGNRVTEERRAVFERFSGRGYRFITLLHPSAVVSPSAMVSAGAQVMAGAVLQPSVTIGPNAIINTRASVDHDCSIGGHVHVAPGAVLSGGVHVGDGAHLGAGCVVIQGIRIGELALVAAGAVVVRNVPALGRVAGNPAREISA